MAEGSADLQTGAACICICCGYETVVFEAAPRVECPECGPEMADRLASTFGDHPVSTTDDGDPLVVPADDRTRQLAAEFPLVLEVVADHE